ncbi:hypothetical protein [Haloferax volcanii]|uniref:DUF8168 domain-containing protein n=1 Tax=Haloferax volcanii TaxID=2246 RepID=A0A847TU06_HALVO|nr:hypothetical protein [Haloferax alexandrinus]NLV04096.1 hypothetical protein [Haloferax alexandrinus]
MSEDAVNGSFAFFGRTYPEQGSLWMEDITELHYESNLTTFDMELYIHGSHILAEVTPTEEVNNLATLRNLVESAVESLTDQLAFLQGIYVHARMIGVIGPDGYKHVFGHSHGAISGRFTPEEISEDWMPKIQAIYHTEAGKYLQHCLTDFRLALEHAEDTGFYCYRAVESLRQYFKSKGVSKTESWSDLRDAVEIDRDTIEENIKQYADDRRHGDPTSITNEDRTRVLETAWEIIRGFVEFADSELTTQQSSE